MRTSDSGLCRYCSYLPDNEYLCDPSDPNICEPCKKLSELEEKVKEIRLMLVGIESERQKLKEQVNHHHDRLIHRLPPEIVAEAFQLCVPDDIMNITLGYIPSRYTMCAPLVLSHVCRRWRDIAHATPPLWKTLFLRSQPSNHQSLPGPLVIKEWLDRAGQLPLSISLYVVPPTECAATPIIDTLNQFSDRWLELRLDSSDSSSMADLSNDNRDLPQLRMLHLRNRDSFCPPTLSLNPTQLEVLSTSGNMLGSLAFSWHHLTQLTIEHVTLSECLEALRRAPHLKKCTFQWDRDPESDLEDYDFSLPQNPLVHAGLQELKLTAFLYYNELFEHLLCPSLKTFALDLGESTPVAMPPLVEFLRTSGCSLESLSIINAMISASDIDSLCSRTMPTLQQLHMELLSRSAAKRLLVHLALFSIVNRKRQPLHFPALRSLHFGLDKFLSKWTMLLPYVCGVPGTHPVERHRHALECVIIHVCPNEFIWGSPHLDLFRTPGEKTMKRILWLREAGVKWKIYFGENRTDLIARAVRRYGITHASLALADYWRGLSEISSPSISILI